MFKKIWEKFKSPNAIWLAIFYLLALAVIGGTITLVVLCPEQSIWHYLLYVLSAVMLTYFVYTIVILAPKIKNGTIRLLNKSKFMAKMLDNYGYRTIAFSIASFCFNLAYVIFVGVFSIITKSYWYFAMSMYYLALSIMKGIVFYYKWKKDNEEGQRKTYLFCGIMFIFLMIAFNGLIVLLYKTNMQVNYAGLMIYVVATYTFVRVSMAIYNIFKAKKQDDLYVQSIRNINLASALVSVVMMQVALIQAFSPENSTTIAHALTGGAVGILIFIIGVLMIVKSRRYKKVKQEEKEDE
ncbi:MAG: hypothetical protein IJZ62_00760 [Clostridia bacterium]|nr:hypothetical protein [Clostridia bacterium]